MSDLVRVNPLYTLRQVVKNTGAVTTNQVLLSDPRRLAFYLSTLGPGVGMLLGTTPNPLSDGGIFVSSANYPLYISRHDVGDVVSGAWWVYYTAGATDMFITEILKVG